jgi:cytidyltransferase-like protein
MELLTPDKLKRYKSKDNRIEEILELKKLTNILDELNISWWLDFGTLLGAYRKNKIISYDIDIDLSCLLTDDVNTHSYVLLTALQKDFYVINYIEDGYISVVPKNENFNLDFIDIYYCKQTDKFIEYNIFPKLKTRSFFVDNLNKIMLENMEFNCLQHSSVYLKIRYGDDYLIEKQGVSNVINLGVMKDKYSVYVPVVADLFHIGHLNLFKKCKSLFDEVIVGVHTDESVAFYKNMPIIPYEQRLEIVRSCRYVDRVYENAPPITTDDVLNNVEADFVVADRESDDRINKLYPMDRNKLHFLNRT